MGYKIITDSTIDMDHKMIEELGLTVVPLRFTIDGKTYKDKADLSDMPTETFYAKLREGKMSTTSQINADEFTRVFEPVLQGGEDVLYIAFSSGLSGTCQSAFIARDELKEKYPERKIYVFDSLCASLGEGLLVYHAAMLKRAGTDIDSLYKWLGENVLKLCHWFTVDDLNHLKRGGRVSATAALVGTLLGVCYYPEHWDTSFWKEDMLRMKSYGIGVIRVAEFAWNLFEPEEGRFDDSFWDRFLNVAKDCGMQVIFCTPTATPPAWLTEKYPEVLNCDIYGHPVYHGMRKHHNMTSPVYLDFVKKIVEHIAAHYGAHPAIIGWQIDNEVNCETNSYHAPSDHEAFRKYLKEKYGTLENLNRAMGTTFWNQTYTDWEQVHLSRYTLANSNNPHMMLEEKRFISEAAINYIGIQADIIRKYRRSEQFITTNGLFGVLDNHKLVKEKLDFITYDSYPNFAFAMEGSKLSPRSLRDRETSFNLAKTRSVSNRFGIMEQQSGPGGWNTRLLQPAPKPGQLRLWTFQSIAHGADFVSYFRWRTCTFGTEMYWHGLLNYDNFPNRRTEELLRVSEDIQKIQRIAGTKHTAKFAILCDYDNEWDGMEDKWHGPLNRESTDGWFKALQRAHIPFEFVNINDEGTSQPLGNFTAAVYPHPTIMTPARAEILRAYAENGGTLFFGCRSGYKDIDGQCPMMPMPGLLAPLTGCTVEDFTFIGPADEKEYMTLGEKKIPAPTFNDILRPDFESCEVLATYDGNYYNGKPALTKNTVGKGTVYACGSVFAEETAAALLELLPKAELCPVTGWLELPEEIELTVRTNEKNGRSYAFLLNYTAQPQTVTVQKPTKELLTRETLDGTYTMEPYGVLVLDKPQ